MILTTCVLLILFNCRDPQVQKVFVDALYDGGPFLQSLPKALASNGMFISQVGEAPYLDSPSEEYSLDKNRVKLIESLVDLGFESVRDYEEVSKSVSSILPLWKIATKTSHLKRVTVGLIIHGSL